MKVIKIGGGSLKGKGNIEDILTLVAERGQGHIIVISALGGITDMLIDSMTEALQNEAAIPSIISHIRNKHILVARHILHTSKRYQRYTRDLSVHLGQLERLYYGLNFTGEVTPKMADVISSFGERLSADLLASALRARGLQARTWDLRSCNRAHPSRPPGFLHPWLQPPPQPSSRCPPCQKW